MKKNPQFAGNLHLTLRVFSCFIVAGPILAETQQSEALAQAQLGLSQSRKANYREAIEAYHRAIALCVENAAIEITPGIPGRLRPIRLIAQDHAYTDKDGHLWEPDLYSKGGQQVVRTNLVRSTDDPELYRGERFGNLSYAIPVAPGRYAITFHFAETWFGPGTIAGGGVGSRIFDILCNGVALRRQFDIYKEAGGPDRAVTWSVHDIAPNPQGKLVISLLPAKNYACINALEVIDESK